MVIIKMLEDYYMMDDINVFLKKFYKRRASYSFHFDYVGGFKMRVIDSFDYRVSIPLSRKITVNSNQQVVELEPIRKKTINP